MIRYNDKLIYSRLFDYKDIEHKVNEKYFIPEEIANEYVKRSISKRNKEWLDKNRSCPYCLSDMRYEDVNKYLFSWGDPDYCEGKLAICSNCNFWHISVSEGDHDQGGEIEVLSLIERYPISSSTLPINDLQRHLKENPRIMRSLDPTVFEKLTSEFLRVEWKDSEVIHVGKNHDNGIDVIIITTDMEKWLIQCKRRASSGAVESIDEVKIFMGTLIQHKELNGILVSTADHFSKGAIALRDSKALKDFGIRIELYDYGKLNQIIPKTQLEEPWMRFFDVINKQNKAHDGTFLFPVRR